MPSSPKPAAKKSAKKSSAKPLLISAGVALAAITLGLVSWQATAPDSTGSAGLRRRGRARDRPHRRAQGPGPP